MFAAGKAASGAEPTDAQFNYVTMLLHGNGTNGAQNNTFVDSSTNNFTITRNGNTTQGTFSPYGSNWSNYFDGTGDYLVVPDNTAFDLAASDWTFETWVNFSVVPASGGAATFASQWRSSSSISYGWFFYLFNNAGTYQLYLTYSTTGTNQSNLFVNLSSAPTNATWNHVAFVRSGTNFLVFWNGVQVGSTQTLNATIFNSTTDVWVGAQNAGGSPDYLLNGYLSNLRLVKGTAVYTSNFTPPTAPLTAITNTSLLTCQSNRFIDNSTNNFTITKNGDVSVQRFSPFSPTTAYSTSVIGGSGYFDGSGDYLTAPNNAALNMGSSDFTYECWLYPTSIPNAYQTFIEKRTSGGYAGVLLAIKSTGKYSILVADSGGTWGIVDETSINVTLNTWQHLAVVRSGSTFSAYLNGVRLINTSITFTLYELTVPQGIGVGDSSGGQPYFGYLSDVRIVKGTAVYSGASFTPPTAPLTAITNTSLLLNYTNAGILDNAMMNDLETVGNAQISTSVKKYGTGSMYLPNTSTSDYLVSPVNGQLTGDFTLEMWLYPTTIVSGNAFLYAIGAETGSRFAFYLKNGVPYLNINGGGETALGSTALSATTWSNLTFVRSGSTITAYINGTSVGSTTSYTGTLGNSSLVYIGSDSGAVSKYKGYIDDLRITKGVARYTANFTPPTAAFADKG